MSETYFTNLSFEMSVIMYHCPYSSISQGQNFAGNTEEGDASLPNSVS